MKRLSCGILPTLLLVAAILAIHQLTIFSSYYPLKALLPILNSDFWNPPDSIFKNSKDRLWLVGKWDGDGNPSPSQRWQPALDAFPNDPSVVARVIHEIPLPNSHLVEAAEQNPDNAWFDLMIAERHAKKVFSKRRELKPRPKRQEVQSNSKERSRRRPSRSYNEIETVNQEELELTLAALRKASEKPHINTYVKSYLQKWANSSKPAHDVPSAYQNFAVWMSAPLTDNNLAASFRVFHHQMETLAESGKKEEFLDLLRTMEKISWSLYDSATTSYELVMVKAQFEAIAKAASDSNEQLSLGAIGRSYKKIAQRIERYREESEKSSFDDENVSLRMFTPLATRNLGFHHKITPRELRLSVIAEQAHLSWRFYLWGYVILAVSVILLIFASRRIKSPRFHTSKWPIAFAVLLPVIGFLVIRYTTKWGGFDKGPG